MSNARNLADIIGSAGTPVVTSNTSFTANVAIAGVANVAQSLTSNTLTVSTNTATIGTAVYVAANGNLGVGTSASAVKLDVKSAVTNTTAFEIPQIRTINSGTSTLNQRVDIAMRWEDGTYNGTGGISMIRESATARSGSLAFSSIPSDGNGTERMRIDSTGNMGLGTTSPTSGTRLDVVSDSTSTQYVNVIRAKTSNTGDYHPFVLLENNRGGTANAIRIGMDTSASLGDSYILFQLKDSGGTFNNRMYIKSTGQVLMPAQPAFAAWGNGGNNGSAGAGNVTALTAKFNIGSHLNNAGLFTAPIAGVYEFIYCLGSNGGSTPRSRIRVNGSDYYGGTGGAGALQLRGEVGSTNLWAVFLIQMAANDTAQIYSEGAYSTESAYLYFQGRLVQ